MNTKKRSFFAPDLHNAFVQLQALSINNEGSFTITITKNSGNPVQVEYKTVENVDTTKFQRSRISLVSLYDLSW